MPGLVGLITKRPREWSARQLSQMVDALRHETFYAAGTWIDEANGVYAGWVARKDSFAAAMPLQNESGQVTLVFSGEEFPEPGTASALKLRGHTGDEGASYLVQRYEEEPDFPRGLNGRFHGLVADGGRGTAALFN